MNEGIIGDIVKKAFEKAKKEHASHSRFALANHISDRSGLSSKTLERVYDRYIGHKGKHGPPHAESIDFLCRYLGHTNYETYRASHREGKHRDGSKQSLHERSALIHKTSMFKGGVIVLVFIGTMLFLDKNIKHGTSGYPPATDCMGLVDTLYVIIANDNLQHPSPGTDLVSLGEHQDSKEVQVDTSHVSAKENGRGLIFFYKNGNGEIEYFNNRALQTVAEKAVGTFVP